MDNLDEVKLNFIIGIGRSGTTLLTKILNTHPSIISNPESRFILHFFRSINNLNSITQKEIIQVSEDILKIKESDYTDLRIWDINKAIFKKAVKNINPQITYYNFSKHIHLQSGLAKRTNYPSIIFDKNPPYTLFFNELEKLNPDIKYIAMVRDYRDNILSRLKYKMDIHNNIYFAALKWSYFNKKIIAAIEKCPDKVCVVRYEDLVNNTKAEVDKICHFINVPFDKSMLEYYKNTRSEYEKNIESLQPKKSKLYEAMHKRLTKPISKDYLYNWKKNMNAYDLAVSEYIAGLEGKYFGYGLFSSSSIPIYVKVFILFYKQYVNLYFFFIESYFRSPYYIRKIINTILKRKDIL